MPTLSEVVKRDHARITDAYHVLVETKPEERNADEFVWALARYLIVENLALIPALEYHISGGSERQRRLSDDYNSVSLLCLYAQVGPRPQTDLALDQRETPPHGQIRPIRGELRVGTQGHLA